MFDRHRLSLDGVPAKALVLEKMVYAAGVESGRTDACRYLLRVRFEDGSTVEIACRAFGHTLAAAAVGDIVPVRYDPADRSRIELDRRAFVEHEEEQARERVSERIARGEQALGLSAAVTPSTADAGSLRIGDGDRDLIAEVLSQHMADGRLTTDELEARLGALYAAQTRAQARAVLADLPPLAASAALPDWLSAREADVRDTLPAARPNGAVGAPVPSDGELNTTYRRWQAKAQKMKEDQAAHRQAEASGDPREPALAFKLTVSRGAEKNARAKLAQLRKRRPDWTPAES